MRASSTVWRPQPYATQKSLSATLMGRSPRGLCKWRPLTLQERPLTLQSQRERPGPSGDLFLALVRYLCLYLPTLVPPKPRVKTMSGIIYFIFREHEVLFLKPTLCKSFFIAQNRKCHRHHCQMVIDSQSQMVVMLKKIFRKFLEKSV